MYRRHGDKLAHLFLVGDLATTALAWLAAYWLRFVLFAAPRGVPSIDQALQALPLVLVAAAAAYRLCGLYEVHRLRELPREFGDVCRACLLMLLLAVTVTFYRRDDYEPRLAFGLFLILNVAALCTMRRGMWRAIKQLRRRGLNHSRAVIVGSDRTARLTAETIGRNAWTGLEAVGFVDDPGRREPSVLPRLGSLGELAKIVERHDVDHVFIALPLARYGELPQVYQQLNDLLVEVQLVPDRPNLAGMRLETLEIDHLSFVSLRQNPQSGVGSLAKRAMDLAVGTAALLILSPLMLGLAAAVKWTSPGPVLYRQRRMGLGGRPFTMLKFRSMRCDAEKRTGAVWAARDDDRCTPLGRWMRRWSLDELPQLLNVLSGDMSLVGPRPERDVFVERFRRELPTYYQRQRVKCGMTGWAQVHGWRGNTSLRKRLEYDLDYVANWSIRLDFKILLLTVTHGFRHKHAY
jgi:exopolysaccharide biosynthesis polyprenyl glycosylphosphotransferase